MRKSNPHTKNTKSKIQCLEVLIPKSFIINNGRNLLWTLSVYSLENQPVKKNRSIHNSEIFHFMVYDWKRTIKQLLEDEKIPYSIIQYFTPDTIYSDAEQDLGAALQSFPGSREDLREVDEVLFAEPSVTEPHLVLDEKTN